MPRKRGRDSSPSPSFSLAQSVRSAGTQVGTQGGGTQGGGTQSDAKQNEPLDFGLVDEALTQAATQDYVFQALPEEADVIEEPEASDCVDERKEEDEISLDVHDLSKEIRALSISLSQQVRAKTLPTLKAPFLPPIPVLHEWFQGFESNGVYQLDAHESPLLAFLLFRAYAEFLVAGQNVPVLFADGVFPKEEGFSPIMAQNTCLLGQLDCLDCPDGPDSEQTLLARMRHHGYNHLVVVNVQTATELNLLMTLSKDLEQTVFATSTQEVNDCEAQYVGFPSMDRTRTHSALMSCLSGCAHSTEFPCVRLFRDLDFCTNREPLSRFPATLSEKHLDQLLNGSVVDTDTLAKLFFYRKSAAQAFLLPIVTPDNETARSWNEYYEGLATTEEKTRIATSSSADIPGAGPAYQELGFLERQRFYLGQRVVLLVAVDGLPAGAMGVVNGLAQVGVKVTFDHSQMTHVVPIVQLEIVDQGHKFVGFVVPLKTAFAVPVDLLERGQIGEFIACGLRSATLMQVMPGCETATDVYETDSFPLRHDEMLFFRELEQDDRAAPLAEAGDVALMPDEEDE